MKNIHVWPYFVSQDKVWFSDTCIGGLYSFDIKRKIVHCEISPDRLFNYGIFRITALAVWRSFVIIFSDVLSGTHIIYDVLTQKIAILSGLENEGLNSIHQAIAVKDVLYLVPTEIKKCIYVIKFDLVNNVEINAFIEKVSIYSEIRTWMVKEYHGRLYIPELGGKRVFFLDKDSKSTNIEVPFFMTTLAVFEEELWVVPMYGEDIYCISFDGKMKECIHVPCGCDAKGKNNIWEIIAFGSFVILLHHYKADIYIYDRKKKKNIVINSMQFRVPNTENLEDAPDFLPYFFSKNTINFLPLRNNYLEIDLTDFSYKRNEIGFHEMISDEKWDYLSKTIAIHRYLASFNDKDPCAIGSFIELIKNEACIKQNLSINYNNRIGERIYEALFAE